MLSWITAVDLQSRWWYGAGERLKQKSQVTLQRKLMAKWEIKSSNTQEGEALHFLITASFNLKKCMEHAGMNATGRFTINHISMWVKAKLSVTVKYDKSDFPPPPLHPGLWSSRTVKHVLNLEFCRACLSAQLEPGQNAGARPNCHVKPPFSRPGWTEGRRYWAVRCLILQQHTITCTGQHIGAQAGCDTEITRAVTQKVNCSLWRCTINKGFKQHSWHMNSNIQCSVYSSPPTVSLASHKPWQLGWRDLCDFR